METVRTMTQQEQGLSREILVVGGVIALGAFMSILDATIVNVAVPTFGRRFHAGISSIQWVMTAYLLTFATVIPVSGFLARRIGATRVWVCALAIFMAGSLFAGAAWSLGALVAARVVQGAGGGLLMPVGQAILARVAGPARMGRVMSIVGIPMLLAPVFGPVIGGVLVQEASWRWVFFVNLPAGAAALALALRLLPPAPADATARLDVPGVALLSPGLALAVYGLAGVGRNGDLKAASTIVPLAAGLVLLVAFTLHALRRGADALLDVRLFANRTFAAASATTFLVGVALFGALILLPLYYQFVRGEGALTTGLLLMPQGLGAALSMPVAGRVTDRGGGRLVIALGIATALLGTAALTQVTATTSYALLAPALFVIGLGLGATIVPAMAVAFAAAGHEGVAHATSAINVIQRLAGSVGTALLAVVLQRALAAEPARDAAASAHAFARSFWLALALVALAFVPALALPRPAKARRSKSYVAKGETHRHAV
jgi:EmrB/QacA subfamily drug resistance transporter